MAHKNYRFLLVLTIAMVSVFFIAFNFLHYNKFSTLSPNLIGAIKQQDSLIISVLTSFSYMFLHGNLLHLVLNLMVLYASWKAVEPYVNNTTVLLLYLTSGWIAGFGVYFFGQSPTIGSSGAVISIYSLNLFYNVLNKHPRTRLMIIESFIFLSIGFIPSFPISGTAHFIGFICGILFGFYYEFYKKQFTLSQIKLTI